MPAAPPITSKSDSATPISDDPHHLELFSTCSKRAYCKKRKVCWKRCPCSLKLATTKAIPLVPPKRAGEARTRCCVMRAIKLRYWSVTFCHPALGKHLETKW